MKKYSMLVGAIMLGVFNLFGILISTIIEPITPVLLATSILVIIFVAYIQLNKRRVLIDSYIKQSYILFGLIILIQIYFTIMALAILVYLGNYNVYKKNPSLNFTSFIAGLNVLPLTQVQGLNLFYYFSNFFVLIYYLRCYYVMFWRENVVFIFRYLKMHVNFLNQSLLSHLPKVELSKQLSQTICSLCLEGYKQGEDITKLHCQHPFHLDCIKLWVMRSNCCPLCRKKVIHY